MVVFIGFYHIQVLLELVHKQTVALYCSFGKFVVEIWILFVNAHQQVLQLKTQRVAARVYAQYIISELVGQTQ